MPGQLPFAGLMADMPGQSLVPHHVRLLRVVLDQLGLLCVHMRKLLLNFSMLDMLGARRIVPERNRVP